MFHPSSVCPLASSPMTTVCLEDEIVVGVWATEIADFAIDAAITVINQEQFIHWRTVQTVPLVFRGLLRDQRKITSVERNGEWTRMINLTDLPRCFRSSCYFYTLHLALRLWIYSMSQRHALKKKQTALCLTISYHLVINNDLTSHFYPCKAKVKLARKLQELLLWRLW